MTLTESINASVEAMPWLTDADQATVELARSYATAIDAAAHDDDTGALTRALYLGPHLLNALATLGAHPAGRKALELRDEIGGQLGDIRARRGRTAPSKKRTSTIKAVS